MNLLAIDTSTDFCSVAASRGEALFSRHERAGQRQAETILGMVDEVLAEAGIEVAQIQGIAYGAGPGSFTGLRIAAGVTQGLALIRAGNIAAAIVLSGQMLALAIPLAAMMAHSVSLPDILLWGLVTVVLQLIAFAAVAVLIRRLPAAIERGEIAPALVLACGQIVAGLLNAAAMSG